LNPLFLTNDINVILNVSANSIASSDIIHILLALIYNIMLFKNMVKNKGILPGYNRSVANVLDVRSCHELCTGISFIPLKFYK